MLAWNPSNEIWWIVQTEGQNISSNQMRGPHISFKKPMMKLNIIPIFIWLYLDMKRTSFVLAQRFVTWRGWELVMSSMVVLCSCANIWYTKSLSSKQVCHRHIRASPNTDPQPPTPQRVSAESTCAKVIGKRKKTERGFSRTSVCVNNHHFLIIPTPTVPK